MTLRDVIDDARYDLGRTSLKDLTVLDTDPFRMDTPANHRDAQWFANVIGTRTLHTRGVHYIAIGTVKPDGTRYANNPEDWKWIGDIARVARWLDYVPFEQITDERNTAPVVREYEAPEPEPTVSYGGVELWVPEQVMPRPVLDDFRPVQEERIVIFGEKTSLRDVLEPVADRLEADLYLPTGNASDTMVHRMAATAADDGRRLQVFYFSDSDPSGWNMAVEVARKLQAFKAGLYPDIEFELRPVALTPKQVVMLGLPSEPMKDTEKRASKWFAAHDVEQTEIDALATLQPDVLTELAEEAIAPYFDSDLADRADEIRKEWEREALARLEEHVGADVLAALTQHTRAELAALADTVDALNASLSVDTTGIDWPDVPDLAEPNPPVYTLGASPPLIDSDDDWSEQTLGLIAHKRYRAVYRCLNCGGALPKAGFCSRACAKAWTDR